MKEWYLNRDPRERQALLLAAIALLVFLVYALAWRPFSQQVERLTGTVAEQQETVAWMRQAADEVRSLRGTARKAPSGASGQSLLALVDGAARKAKLTDVIRRVEPQGTDAVQIWLEKAPFDTVLGWVGALQRDYGVTITTVSVTRESGSGRVNAHLALQGGQP